MRQREVKFCETNPIWRGLIDDWALRREKSQSSRKNQILQIKANFGNYHLDSA